MGGEQVTKLRLGDRMAQTLSHSDWGLSIVAGRSAPSGQHLKQGQKYDKLRLMGVQG